MGWGFLLGEERWWQTKNLSDRSIACSFNCADHAYNYLPAIKRLCLHEACHDKTYAHLY